MILRLFLMSTPRSVRTATVSGLFSIRKRHKNGILAAVKRGRFGRQRSVKFRFTAYSFSDCKLSVPQTVSISPFTTILQLNYNLSPRPAIRSNNPSTFFTHPPNPTTAHSCTRPHQHPLAQIYTRQHLHPPAHTCTPNNRTRPPSSTLGWI